MESVDKRAYLAQISSIVDEHGVCIQYVGAGEGERRFAYTVGLFARGHPEFITFDLPPTLAQGLLNDLAYAVLRGGMSFSHADRVHRLVRDGFGWLVTVDDPGKYLGVAYELRDRRVVADAGSPLSALQLVFADSRGKWLWEAPGDDAASPLLGAPPSPGEGVDQSLPAAEVRRSPGW